MLHWTTCALLSSTTKATAVAYADEPASNAADPSTRVVGISHVWPFGSRAPLPSASAFPAVVGWMIQMCIVLASYSSGPLPTGQPSFSRSVSSKWEPDSAESGSGIEAMEQPPTCQPIAMSEVGRPQRATSVDVPIVSYPCEVVQTRARLCGRDHV